MSGLKPARNLRNLAVVCGDQLDSQSAAFTGFDPECDAILMTEAAEEASYVWQHKRRIALFFSAMRHFAAAQRDCGRPMIYNRIDDENPPESLAQGLTAAIRAHSPERILLVRPGDYRVLQSLQGAANAARTPLDLIEDNHFLTTPEAFASFGEGRKRFILEDFYRRIRRDTGLLMDDGDPAGGAWNFDKENRKTFGKKGPGMIPGRAGFDPDGITRTVLKVVEDRFADSPGTLDGFDEPVTRDDALAALDDFIENRLREFGSYQDAMWDGSSTLYHSRLSTSLNLKLLNPREVCARAIEAYEAGNAPINSVEGFVRQVAGWREFTRGIYWANMPGYAAMNALEADLPVPDFFWTGETEMACLRDMISRLLATGYAHHIERLMGMGLFLLLRGTNPHAAHEWHMGLYLDAIDWVSLPNMLGMSQHGDGGIVGTKPYCASGSYIDRMSNYCAGCRYNPKQAIGDEACPFTSLYWDFLARHEECFSENNRMKLQLNNLRRKDAAEIRDIRKCADKVRS